MDASIRMDCTGTLVIYFHSLWEHLPYISTLSQPLRTPLDRILWMCIVSRSSTIYDTCFCSQELNDTCFCSQVPLHAHGLQGRLSHLCHERARSLSLPPSLSVCACVCVCVRACVSARFDVRRHLLSGSTRLQPAQQPLQLQQACCSCWGKESGR